MKDNWINKYQQHIEDKICYKNSEKEFKTPEKLIPNDAHSFEVFAIQDCEYSYTGKQAFIGFKIENGNFHFIGVPYTEPINK
jgi:hypothetical protein